MTDLIEFCQATSSLVNPGRFSSRRRNMCQRTRAFNDRDEFESRRSNIANRDGHLFQTCSVCAAQATHRPWPRCQERMRTTG